MKCFVQILHIEDGRATVEITEDEKPVGLDKNSPDDLMDLPLSILPENSKAGDILQLQISFCPFKTLVNIG